MRLGIFANLIGSLFLAEEELGLPVSKELLTRDDFDVRPIHGASANVKENVSSQTI